MDPDACLAMMLANAARIMQDFDSADSRESVDAIELATCVQNMDRWLESGGFRPERWSK